MTDFTTWSHHDFRQYLLSTHAELFARDFEAAQKQSFALQYLPQCESGWYNLIDEACWRIKGHLQEHEWLEPHEVLIRQIKEKFGGLRIYCRPDDDDAWPDAVAEGVIAIRQDIEQKADKTCEVCGQPGKLEVIDSYHQTLCPNHAAKRLQWVEAGRPDIDWRK